MKFEDSNKVWQLYEEGQNHHRRINLYANTTKNYNFFEGRQWEGLKSPVEPPTDNVIQHIVKYKYNTMAMSDIQTVYHSEDEGYEAYEKALDEYSKNAWEKMKLHHKLWEMAKGACITGDSYIFFPDSFDAQIIDNIDIYFSDEQSTDIQNQQYILITERLQIKDVKERARECGCSEEELMLIVSDDEINEKKQVTEVKDNDKCTSILLLWKENETVHFLRSVKNLIYQKAEDTKLKIYPIAGLVINKIKWSSRGMGDVAPLIPNQIAINKTLYRRIEAIKDTAFPKIVYDEQKISNPKAINKVGGMIGVRNTTANKISEIISYLQPSYVGNDAKEITDELILLTKELNGSGDGATGQIDPEKVSGEAVKAVTAQASIHSMESNAAYKQLVEDIGLILMEMWKNYNPNGLETEQGTIPIDTLDSLKMDIEVAPATPFDKLAVENSLKELFTSGAITFEEFVDSLPENGNMPKAILKKIVEKRKLQQDNQFLQIIDEQQKQLAMYQAENMANQELINEGEMNNGEY